MYKQYKLEFKLNNMLMHNAQTCDPTNKYAIEMKKISSKRKKVDSDYFDLANLEYRAGLYVNNDQEVIIPSRIFEANVLEGARKSKQGKDSLASVFCEQDAVISYDGGPLTIEQLLESEKHRSVMPVRVQRARVMRCRPYFENVTGTTVFALDTTVSQASDLERWIKAALELAGIGDLRPRYGRGRILSFTEIKD